MQRKNNIEKEFEQLEEKENEFLRNKRTFVTRWDDKISRAEFVGKNDEYVILYLGIYGHSFSKNFLIENGIDVEKINGDELEDLLKKEYNLITITESDIFSGKQLNQIRKLCNFKKNRRTGKKCG